MSIYPNINYIKNIYMVYMQVYTNKMGSAARKFSEKMNTINPYREIDANWHFKKTLDVTIGPQENRK